MASKHWEQNKDATVYVGNLDERFGEALMWELMTQMGPVINVHMPMDRVSRTHQGYGFVEFDTPESADYAARCLNGIRVWGKPIRVNKASADKQKTTEIGAELFINNLDAQVDEKILFDTFSQFGLLVTPPNVIRDQNNISKGYGFVNYDSFEASDAARDAMNGQYLLSKQISVEYAYKKDGRGERHGDDAERKLASEGKKHNIVPEQQPLPPAFLMNGPRGAAASATTSGGNNGTAPNAPGAQPGPAAFDPIPQQGLLPPPTAAAMMQQQQQQQQQMAPPGFGPPPMQPMMGRGAPPGMAPLLPPPGFGAMPSHPGPAGPMGPPLMGGRGALPPAPSGLPARPPPSQAGFSGPVAAPPLAPSASFRGGPPGAPHPPGFAAPPPGFPGASAVGAVPMLPPGAPFAPPPGFGAPPGQVPAPAGFGRR